VTYLRTAKEREPHRVTIGTDGRLYDRRGKPVDCASDSLLVADTDGNLFLRDMNDIRRDTLKDGQPAFNHASMLGGEPAEMSIEVRVDDGWVKHAKNRSGHYRPSRLTFMAWLLRLESRGLDLANATVSFDLKSVVEDSRSR
jgi:hypothetical protein